MYRISRLHVRFAIKLAFAIVMALLVSFHFHLETPRWAVLTAALVAGGPAYAAGGEPYSGAIRYRGMLRIAGTLIGCVASLVIIINLISAPPVMLIVCCLWAGFCTWLSSLVRAENAYAWGLSGYTALIIVISINADPLSAPQFAIERCNEIVIGIVCAIVADLLFSPRSIKQKIDAELDSLLVAQYQLMQICILENDNDAVDRAWNELVRRCNGLSGMRSNLKLESSRWALANQRLKAINTLALTQITQACETFLTRQIRKDYIPEIFVKLFSVNVESAADVHRQMKILRRAISLLGEKSAPVTMTAWTAATTRYLLLKHGFISNRRANGIEEEILEGEVVVSADSAEGHYALINFWRTTLSCMVGCLFWLWTGWTSGSAAMIMIAIVTALAMRLPDPRRMAIDFFYGMIAALPLSSFYFLVVMPSTQQSILLLCLSLGLLGFFIGLEVQKRQLGSLGLLTGSINVLVLDNPMTFNFSAFLDNAFGQIAGSLLALLVIILIRDNSRSRTGRTLLNQFVSAAVSALTTNKARRKENHLPSLYQQLFLLITLFPGDIDRYRLALTLIISHQRLRDAPIPVNEDLSACHRQLRKTANKVVTASNDNKRQRAFLQLLDELAEYQTKLETWGAPERVTGPVKRLADFLHQYRSTLIQG